MHILRAGLLLYFGLLGAAPTCAQDALDKFFDTRTAKHFGDARGPLIEFLKGELPLKQPQHYFCVVGYENSEGLKRAWVYWREGKKMILWEGSAEPASAKAAIQRSRRQLDLQKDVVKSEADVGGSSYLVTESWVNKIKADCLAKGAKYSVNRPTRKG